MGKVFDKENVTWFNLLNENDVNDLYFVKEILTIFLVYESTGKVMGDKLGGEFLDQKLTEVFK